MTQNLRNWVYDANGQPVVGADVYVYDASLLAGNPNSILSQTQTDPNGMYSVTGLTETAKDVKVAKTGNDGVRRESWIKGFARVNLESINVTGTWKSGILTTRGDLIVMDSTPTPTRLGIGANKTVLGSNGSDPSWMSSVTLSGSLTAETGVNVGTTGAGAGVVKTSSHVLAGGQLYPNGESVGLSGFNAKTHLNLAAGGTVTFTGRQGYISLMDATTGNNCLLSLRGGAGSVGTVNNDSAATWNIGSLAGSVWNVTVSGTVVTITNSSGAARSFYWAMFGIV